MDNEKRNNSLFLLSIAMQFGFSLAIPLVLGIGGGVWLDKTFNTAPICTLVGLFLGLGASIYTLYTDLLPFLQKQHKNQ